MLSILDDIGPSKLSDNSKTKTNNFVATKNPSTPKDSSIQLSVNRKSDLEISHNYGCVVGNDANIGNTIYDMVENTKDR